MKILLASSEVHPYSKTGGLADMVGALGKDPGSRRPQVGTGHAAVPGHPRAVPGLKPLACHSICRWASAGCRARSGLWRSRTRLTIYFIDQPEFYQRAGLCIKENGVDYPDNAERFIFFSKADRAFRAALEWQPEWSTCTTGKPVSPRLFLHHHRACGRGLTPRTCMTIHNLAYQGVFPPRSTR